MSATRIFTMLALGVSLAACQTTVVKNTEEKTGIETTTVSHKGCGSPSVTALYINRPGKKEDSVAFSGPDLCNTAVAGAFGAVGQIVSAGIIRPANSNTTLISAATASQGTKVQIGN